MIDNLIAQTVFDSNFGIPFFAMVGVFLISTIYPTIKGLPNSRLVALSSVLIAPLWFVYEELMPSHMNIRVDLLIIIPMALVSAILLVVRFPWLLRTSEQPKSRND